MTDIRLDQGLLPSIEFFFTLTLIYSNLFFDTKNVSWFQI